MRAYLIVFLSLLLIQSSFAQTTKKVSGRVVSQTDNRPIPDVNVRVKGTNRVIQTDSLGKFSIDVGPSDAALLFSNTSYLTKEEVIANRSVINVSLVSTVNELDNVIIIGYGTTTKKDLTGSIGEVKIADLQKAPVASFDQALAGRIAGLQVTSADGQPGADMNIVIRGNNSITQSNSPLYVVDGFPIEESLNNILNPSDIESIQVLKDASATAIYGARGANGVIVITTKTAARGAAVIKYDNFFTVMENVQRQEMMSPYEFVKYQIELRPSLTTTYFTDGKTLESYRNMKGTDWQDYAFQKALMQNHSLSISGGSDKTKYVISSSIMDQEGIIINSGIRRYQGRLRLDQEVTNKLRVGLNLNYTATKTYGTVASEIEDYNHPSAALMYSIWGFRPVTGSDELDQELLDEPYDPDLSPSVDFRFNPILTLANAYNPTFRNSFFSTAFANYKILKDLELNVSGGWTKSDTRAEVFNNSKTRSGSAFYDNKVNGSVTNTNNNYYLNENTLTYTHVFNRVHRVKVLGGFTYQKNTYSSDGFSAIRVPNESLGISGLDEGEMSKIVSRFSENALASFLGRVDYSYKGKYLSSFSYRRDGSSKFSDANKWANFYAGSVAWRISGEKFMSKLKFINDAKIRVGYGITGNNRVPDFASSTSLQINPGSGYVFGNTPDQGLIPNTIGSKDLKWETTGQLDLGLDLRLFKDRITFTTDYYKKDTKDLLLLADIPLSSGYATGYKNIGRVSNEGLEFTITTLNISTNKFTWSSSFNIAFNRNKVLQLNSNQNNLQTEVAWGPYFRDAAYIAVIDKPVSMFYGYIFDGIYQYSDFDQGPNSTYTLKENVPNNGDLRTNIKPGFIKYKDINGDGQVDSQDQTIIGNPNPIHIGGFSNNFTYGGFDLNIFLQWSYGNQILNANKLIFEGHRAVVTTNQFATFVDRWTPENQTNEMFSAKGQGPLVYSDRVLSDGSFLRLKTVSFGYNLPKSLLERIKIKSLRVFISGQNLCAWDNYNGLDPEVSVRNSALTPGFDYSAYPRARTFAAGLNLTL